MKTAVVVAALVALLAVAAEAQIPTNPPADVTAPDSTRYCHLSCYSTACEHTFAVKASLLEQGAPGLYKIEAQACNAHPDCTAIMLYTFANQADHDAYQAKEKVPPLSTIYDEAGLKSATPTGLAKSGPCAGFKVW